MAQPPVVRPRALEVAAALAAGAVVAVPAVGGYCLAVRAGIPEAERRIEALTAPREGVGAVPSEGPDYLVGDAAAVRQLAGGCSDELAALLTRCWPGPLEVSVDCRGEVIRVGLPEGRALRKLCRRIGPWRAAPLGVNEAAPVAAAFSAAEVACVVDGGRHQGEPPTVVDATATPLRVVREGALPAAFIEGTMLMSKRRRRFGGFRRSRTRPSP
ncbi:MAG TPA: Sua5/YciO/YrdC/YwlC family protein [Acidimicrobiales bacterium]|nr:Sua5/YciO/YrdC/YwlC family protein [Acidimicrobiales bacterium]